MFPTVLTQVQHHPDKSVADSFCVIARSTRGRLNKKHSYYLPHRITIQNINERLPANPPTSPTMGNTPTYSPREDPQLPPSPVGEVSHVSVSVVASYCLIVIFTTQVANSQSEPNSMVHQCNFINQFAAEAVLTRKLLFFFRIPIFACSGGRLVNTPLVA